MIFTCGKICSVAHKIVVFIAASIIDGSDKLAYMYRLAIAFSDCIHKEYSAKTTYL